ncbi:hypothetical protein ABZS94_28720 [Streptomyces sp. NPDC005500]
MDNHLAVTGEDVEDSGIQIEDLRDPNEYAAHIRINQIGDW